MPTVPVLVPPLAVNATTSPPLVRLFPAASLACSVSVTALPDRDLLLPHAALVTPNTPEAEALSGIEIRTLDDMRRAARLIVELGARAALIKGGHTEGDAVDVLFDGTDWREFRAPRLTTRHTHGTGCTHSAAITAGLASGLSLIEAVERAKRYIQEAIRGNPGLGSGCGPVNHHARCD